MKIPLAIAATAMLGPGAGLAQSGCAARDIVVQELEQSHGERFAGGGLQDASAIFEVWTSDEGGTWTILLTRPDGTSCVMASGVAWREALPSERLTGVPG